MKIGSSCCSDTSGAPAATYWPTSTLRMPSRPAKAAWIFFCAISARVRSRAPAAWSRTAWARSKLDRDAAGSQHLLALEGQIGVFEHGDIGSLVGLLGRIVDTRQKSALFDVLAV